MGYRECEYYCDGYCIMGEKTAQRMKYTCIERNDCIEVTATYLKLPYIKPEIYPPSDLPRGKGHCIK